MNKRQMFLEKCILLNRWLFLFITVMIIGCKGNQRNYPEYNPSSQFQKKQETVKELLDRKDKELPPSVSKEHDLPIDTIHKCEVKGGILQLLESDQMKEKSCIMYLQEKDSYYPDQVIIELKEGNGISEGNVINILKKDKVSGQISIMLVSDQIAIGLFIPQNTEEKVNYKERYTVSWVQLFKDDKISNNHGFIQFNLIDKGLINRNEILKLIHNNKELGRVVVSHVAFERGWFSTGIMERTIKDPYLWKVLENEKEFKTICAEKVQPKGDIILSDKVFCKYDDIIVIPTREMINNVERVIVTFVPSIAWNITSNNDVKGILINSGKDKGINTNQMLIIKRDGKRIAECRVKAVYKNNCFALVIKKDQGVDIKATDRIIWL